MKASALRRGMNLWPPLLFSGIRIRHISDDFRAVDVELRERFYNKNYVGCHFGGSLFAMTDPFWMMMVMRNLDRSYTVWDKSAEIDFLRPGRGTGHCQCRGRSGDAGHQDPAHKAQAGYTQPDRRLNSPT
jgi:acyl-coenzyme A thioesterase PaaI-like protein